MSTDISDVQQFAKDAEKATQAAAFTAFGRARGKLRNIVFDGVGKTPLEVSRDEFENADPFSRAQELVLEVDSSEFNPQQRSPYVRRNRMGSGDWRRTTAPSILNVFGSFDEFARAMATGCYVCVQDVPQLKDDRFNAPKFVERFARLEDCAKAWAEHYGKHSVQRLADDHVPPELVETARAVRQAVPDDTTFIDVIKADAKLAPFADRLIELLKSA